MNRRNFLKDASFIAIGATTLDFFGAVAHAQSSPAPSTGVPAGEEKNAALSTEPRFHHYHFLFVPQSVLNNIPAQGYQTTTTMVRTDLGVDPRLIAQKRQSHYHVVNFTRAELQALAAGKTLKKRITVEGAPNHLFTFNDPSLTFQTHVANVQQKAKADRTLRLKFDNDVPKIPARIILP